MTIAVARPGKRGAALRYCTVLACLAIAGCTRDAEPQAPAAATVELIPITHTEWTTRLADYAPDIVVVDMWATWCAPCIERFPKMVEMHRAYGDQGVRFVSMSLEDREDAPAIEGTRRFLIEQNAEFDNFLMDENIIDAFEKLDLLGIPAVLIYDREGSLRHRLTGDDPRAQFSDEDVEAAVVALLAEQPVTR